MRVFVHGGMHKAGSSAVQAYLAAARSELSAIGIDYPDFGHRGHWAVSAAFAVNPHSYHQANRRIGGKGVDELVAGIRGEIAAWIETNRTTGRILLLSHEDLSVSATAKRMERFIDERLGAAGVHLLAYVRDPVSMFPSAIQQAMKSDRSRSLLPSHWINPHIQRTLRLKRDLAERTTLKPFAPRGTDGWDVIDDFRRSCGALVQRDLPAAGDIEDVNTSYSAEATAVLELGRMTLIHKASARSLSRLCRLFDNKATGTKLRVPEAWVNDIQARNAEGWNEAVSLLDCSAEQKAAASYETRALSRTYVDSDIRAWLLSGLDRDWCDRFAAFCHTVDLPQNAGVRVSRWIERDVLSAAA